MSHLSNKEINLQILLSLDEQIRNELGALESNVNQLPQDSISLDLYSDYMARFNRIRSLFDRFSDLLRDAPLEQANPDLYDILLVKKRVSDNYNIFSRTLGRFTQRYKKYIERDQGIGERPFVPTSAPAEEEASLPEEDHYEESPDGPSDEEIEAALAEEEAAEVEAAKKKKAAEKKVNQEKAQQEERTAIEQDRLQKESEHRAQDDLRRMEDRRLEDDRLAQDRARDAMLLSDPYKNLPEGSVYPPHFYPEPPAYDSPIYDRESREFEHVPESRSPEYERSYPDQSPSFQAQERFYPSHQEDFRQSPDYPGREEYSDSYGFDDRRYESPRPEEQAYTSPDRENNHRPQQSAADLRNQDLRDAEQRAREAQRRDDIRREQDERFERYRDRQQSSFTREDQQFAHLDYSVREGETGRRERGHSDYNAYDSREEYTRPAAESAPGDTPQRAASHQDRGERFDRYRNHQQDSFTREDPQRGFLDYPAHGGETGHREQGHSDYNSYDFREEPAYFERKYTSDGAKQRSTSPSPSPRSEEFGRAATSRPEFETRRQAPQSAADIRSQELRDSDQHTREIQRREEIHRDRDERFARYKARQQTNFTRNDQQRGHFDYSAREGETGHRKQGHSDYRTYDSRKGPTYTAYEYAPGGTTHRPATVGPTNRNNSQQIYPSAHPSSIHPVDFQAKACENKQRSSSSHSSAQYNFLPGGGIAGTGISGGRPNGSTSYFNSRQDIPSAPSSYRAASQRQVQGRSKLSQQLPHGYKPLSAAGGQISHPDPVSQINRVVASRNVMRTNPLPSPVPAGPRHFHINTAKSDPNISQVSQIPGFFRKQQESSQLADRKSYIIRSIAGKPVVPNGPGSMGSSGQSKDGSSNGNGPRKSKVEETSSDLLNRKSKLRTESIATHYSRIISGRAESYACSALMMASRKFYQIVQSGDDNSLRTLEQGRYYGTVAAGLASAYMHRKPVNSMHAIKSAGRREFREFGRFATMDKKQLTRNIHESLKANRQLKNDIRELTAKGSSLTVAERAELLKKRGQLVASSLEPRKMHGYRNMQAAHARDIRANKLIEKTSEGGRITTKTVQKAMQADYKACEAAMKAKFGKLNLFTDKSLRLEIQQKTQLGRVLKKEIKELKALQASGVKLTPAQAKKLSELLAKREANNKALRQLHGLKKSRLESNLSQKALQNKMTRLAKNKAAVRGGLYALYGIITKPIREGSEIGAQGLLKFANIASNHYVHEFIRRSLLATKKTYLWSAKITRFNRTAFYKNTAKKAQKMSSAMKGAPKKAVKATGHVVKKGAIHTYQRVAPVKVKTAVSSAYNRYTGAKGAIVAAKAKAKEWFANTWVGRAYSSVSNFLGGLGRGISSALNMAKAILAKAALILLILAILLQIVSMVAGGGGGIASSVIMSPYEGPDDKLDLGPYNAILDNEWNEYMDELQQKGVQGNYYKVTVDMDVNPDNVKEILSMMAVRCGQELDLLTNLTVKPYIEDLLRASHPYWTEKYTATCDNIDTCSNKKSCSEDGKKCSDSSSELCSHGHRVSKTESAPSTYTWICGGHRGSNNKTAYCTKNNKSCKKNDVLCASGHVKETKHTQTAYYWDCDGHCGGHPCIIFHVRTLSFDEIFEVDPHGYPSSDSATASTGGLRGYYTVTYYCNEKYPHTCNAGPPYKTATGAEPKPGRTIAVDPNDIALGAHVVIDGHEYVAEDTGGAVNGKHIDILVNTHAEALQKGTQYNVPVYKVKYDGESMEKTGEWSGWTDDNREWVKTIYEQDWTELYCGIPNVTDEVGSETDLSGVKFVNGSRPGHDSIVDIARSQEGQVGGRPYWSWYGFNNRVEWCACFVSWCANKDGVLNTKIPKFASCTEGARWFVEHKQWAKRGATTPVAGDIIFFSWDSDRNIDHVGIVIGSDNTNVYTIEGNSRDKCRVKSYPLNSSVIYGYGLPNY